MSQYPEAYVEFLAHFHGTRDYFECHELLEASWKRERDPALKAIWHGLIQVAVALYHQRRGNLAGAFKMLSQGADRLKSADVLQVGLEPEALRLLLEERLKGLKEAQDGAVLPYSDPELPVADEDLLHAVQELCAVWKAEWNRPSPVDQEDLIHRHARRDRTEIIEERRRKLAEKERS